MRVGLAGVGATASNQVVIYDDLMDSNSLFLTLHRDGPTVVEIPPGCGPGTVDDAWFASSSIDLYFGPEPPEEHESNWTQTVPGKGWFTRLRLCGPTEPWFDLTWRPDEFERV